MRGMLLFFSVIAMAALTPKVHAQALTDDELFGVASPAVVSNVEHISSAQIVLPKAAGAVVNANQLMNSTSASNKVANGTEFDGTEFGGVGALESDGPGGPDHQFESVNNSTGEETGEH